MATPFMNLTLPVPSVTLGVLWAEQLNAALEQVDSHDHSSGFGIKIKPSGLDITSDLDFQSNAVTFLQRSNYTAQSGTLTGSLNSNSVYSVLGNLYWTNGSGVAVQLTSGGSIVSSPAAVNSLQYNEISTDLTIAPSDAFVVIAVNTSAPRSVTLPSAAAVIAGRIYEIKDSSGLSETNAITLNADGLDEIDGDSSISLESDYGAWLIIGNGVDSWRVI